MKKIAVIDIAAENSGAKTVFDDFIEYISLNSIKEKYQWDIYTSLLDIKESKNIKLYKDPAIKKSWVHRILWERLKFKSICQKKDYDLIISLQNKTLPVKGRNQIVYFHNILLAQNKVKFSFFNKDERLLYIYSKFIGPLTIRSLKKASAIFVQNNATKKVVLQKKINKPVYVIKPNIVIKKNGTFPREKKIKGLIYPSTALAYKNHELIIQAVNEMNWDKEFEILFTITGDENNCAKIIKNKCSMNPHIRFIGRLEKEQLLNLYSQYGLINTSKLESFGFPLYEAQLFNTPIVSINYEYAIESLSKYPYKFISTEHPKVLANCINEAMEHEYSDNYKITNTLESQWEKLIDWIQTNINK